MMMESIKKEILLSSYWEHFKYAKDLALTLPVDNEKRKLVEKTLNELSKKVKL